MIVRCISTADGPAWGTVEQREECIVWLETNVGLYDTDWKWSKFGYVLIYDDEAACAFKLKFGI